MLLDLEQIAATLDFNIQGILHLGANLAQEASTYYDMGVRNVVWVEGNPDLEPKLKNALRPYDMNRVLIALISDQDGAVVPFNISNYDSLSSSLFQFGTHTDFSPDTVWVDEKVLTTRTVDSLAEERNFTGINFLAMDLQGAEMLALKGAESFLNQIDYVYTEVSFDAIYIGGVLFPDLLHFLMDHGFRLLAMGWGGPGWGDAVFRRVT